MSSPRFYSTRIGNALPPDAEVVWNGTYDRTAARAVNAEAMRPGPVVRKVMPLDMRPARVDTASTRACDRVLGYVVSAPERVHTSRTVAEALGMDVRDTSVYLKRLRERGVLFTDLREPTTVTGGRGAALYHVVPLPAVS